MNQLSQQQYAPNYAMPHAMAAQAALLRAERSLKWLFRWHVVYAVLLALTSVGVVLCTVYIFSTTADALRSGGRVPRAQGSMALGSALMSFFAVLTFLWSLVVALSAFLIRIKKLRWLSCGVATLCLLSVPFGTAFGIYALVTLFRSDVRALYG